jgi:hypothetical protein
MSPTELSARVTRDTGGLVAALTLLAGWVGGAAAAVGVCAGGALALVNFLWLSGRVVAVLGDVSGGSASYGGWVLGFGLRLVTLAVATGFLVGSGWAHPVGVVVGLTVLPCTLIMRGLAQASARS